MGVSCIVADNLSWMLHWVAIGVCILCKLWRWPLILFIWLWSKVLATHSCSTLVVVVVVVAVGANTCHAIQHSCVDHGPPRSHAHTFGMHHIVLRRQPMLAMRLAFVLTTSNLMFYLLHLLVLQIYDYEKSSAPPST